MKTLSRFLSYLASGIFVLLASLCTHLAGSLLQNVPFALFYAAIAASAWVGGLGPGLLASLLAFLCVHVLFLDQLALTTYNPKDVFSAVTFATVAIVVSLAASREKKALSSYRAVESELQSALDSMSEFFFAVDNDWRIVHLNQKFLDFSRKRALDMPGATIWETYPQLLGTIYEEKYREAKRTGEPCVFEAVSAVTNSWFEVRVFPSAKGLSVFAADVSMARQARELERESEARFRVMADQAPVLIWISDESKACTWFNQTWINFTGRTQEQEAGYGWAAGVHVEDLEACVAIYDSSFDSRTPFVMEYRLRHHDGEYRWLLDSGIPLYTPGGTFTGYIGSCVDISQIKALAEERDRLLKAERTARESAERSNLLKDEFLATLSHELRTPLNSILGWSQMLSTGDLTADEVSQAVATVERNARLQTSMVDDLLDMSRISTGRMRLENKLVDASFAVTAAVDSVQPTAMAKGIALNQELTQTQLLVWGDPDRLQQVVWNLLVNAVKFTERGGIVTVSLVRREDNALITVSDTGEGILPEFLPYVFDRFRQEDASYTRRVGGLGLGLGLVSQLVALMGGHVRAYSEGKGLGARFEVEIPLVTEATGAPAPVPSEQESLVPGSLAGLRILVVEDEADSRSLLDNILSMQGATVQLAQDVAVAQDYLKQFKPDVVISDLGMPGADGFDLARWIRSGADGLGSNVPCVALTAYASEADKQKALESGFDLCLVKPFSPSDLVKALRSCLRYS